MVVQGARINGDGELDLTRLKLSIVQLLLLFAMGTGLISTAAVSLYQLSELKREVIKSTFMIEQLAIRINELEKERARREGALMDAGGYRR